jgi:hypothetical protein
MHAKTNEESKRSNSNYSLHGEQAKVKSIHNINIRVYIVKENDKKIKMQGRQLTR